MKKIPQFAKEALFNFREELRQSREMAKLERRKKNWHKSCLKGSGETANNEDN